jgi:hypothetical protein
MEQAAAVAALDQIKVIHKVSWADLVDMVYALFVIWQDKQFNKWHTPVRFTLDGFYNMCIHTERMTATEKLVFIASFFWLMNWGTRVTSAAINALS